LLDREVPSADRIRIRALATADARIGHVHDLRTRTSGPYLHIQFHADLEPTLTLEEAHKILVAAEERIRAEFPTADIIIHPDPSGRAEPHGHEHFERASGG
jgi:divalent metal cation (Fe/Co/Zn/Cd) transporter